MYLHKIYYSLITSATETSLLLTTVVSGINFSYFEEIGIRASMTAFALFNLFLLFDTIFHVTSFIPDNFIISRITEPATSPRPLFGRSLTFELENFAESS